MTPPTLEQQLRSAKAALREAVRLSRDPTPAALDRCIELMVRAQAPLQSLAGAPQPQPSRLLAEELLDMQKSLFRLKSLLEHAADFYDGWNRLRNTLTGGYSNRGEPAASVPVSRLSVEA